jgi:cbb3-type cytochrome oxidase subunit 3
MPFLLLDLFKRFAPYIAVALLLVGVWWHGYRTADTKRIESEARIAAQSNLLIAQATKRNADIQAQAAQSARIIGETYDANHKTIADLSAYNRDLLARLRRQPTGCGTGGMPDTTSAARIGDAVDPGIGGILESAVDQSRIADEVTETARACQAYVKTLQEVFK